MNPSMRRGLGPSSPPKPPSVSDILWAEIVHPGNLKMALHVGTFVAAVYVFREYGDLFAL
ncbi:hypothetical protein HDU93_004865 [Gonapodya sp. JEL0774]|nr:hypothetical protein HDU93_004865 [Gonapodya sp. JEL0774]